MRERERWNLKSSDRIIHQRRKFSNWSKNAGIQKWAFKRTWHKSEKIRLKNVSDTAAFIESEWKLKNGKGRVEINLLESLLRKYSQPGASSHLYKPRQFPVSITNQVQNENTSYWGWKWKFLILHIRIHNWNRIPKPLSQIVVLKEMIGQKE